MEARTWDIMFDDVGHAHLLNIYAYFLFSFLFFHLLSPPSPPPNYIRLSTNFAWAGIACTRLTAGETRNRDIGLWIIN